MTARGGVHHVDLVVSSIERSLPFYRDLLAPLGYHHVSEVEGERGETIWYLGGRDVIEVGLRETQSEGEVDRYRVGLHHLAFEVSSRAVVDDRERPAGVRVRPRLLRGLLLRPRRDQARDRPHPGPGGLKKGARDG